MSKEEGPPKKKARRAEEEDAAVSGVAANPKSVSELLSGLFSAASSSEGGLFTATCGSAPAKPEKSSATAGDAAPAAKKEKSSGKVKGKKARKAEAPAPAAGSAAQKKDDDSEGEEENVPAEQLGSKYSSLFDPGKKQAKATAAASVSAKPKVVNTAALLAATRFAKSVSKQGAMVASHVKQELAKQGKLHALGKQAEAEEPEAEKKSKSKMTPEEREERDARTVFIGNVPLWWDEKKLRTELREAVGEKYKGKFSPLWFRSEPINEDFAFGKKRKVGSFKKKYSDRSDAKNAYVVVDTEEAVKIVRFAIHGKEADSRHILRCDGVGAAAKLQSFDRKRSVFVGNLPRNCSELDLRRVFEKCGEVSAVRVVRDRELQECKGIAFVLFKERSCVKVALKLKDATIKGREIRVSKVETPDGEEGAGKGKGKGKGASAPETEDGEAGPMKSNPALQRIEASMKRWKRRNAQKQRKRRELLEASGVTMKKRRRYSKKNKDDSKKSSDKKKGREGRPLKKTATAMGKGVKPGGGKAGKKEGKKAKKAR